MLRDSRKIAAILAADVVDYSRLMGADEAGTLAAPPQQFERNLRLALEQRDLAERVAELHDVEEDLAAVGGARPRNSGLRCSTILPASVVMPGLLVVRRATSGA